MADLVWSRLGNPDNYIEPFCGSAAMLLRRPGPPRVETLNDADGFLCNFWRATKMDPERVAEFADDPVNEIDLHARHRWLLGIEWPEPDPPEPYRSEPLLREAWLAGYRWSPEPRLPGAGAGFLRRLQEDPNYFDARVAGLWCWGLSQWIGSGWCDPNNVREDGLTKERRPRVPGGYGSLPGVHKKRPEIGGGGEGYTKLGQGVHARGPTEKLPRMNGARRGDDVVYGGLGVHCDLPRGRPQLADAHARGRGVHANDQAETCAERRAWLLDWFGRLRDRLRVVRVLNGHWKRACGSRSTMTRLGLTSVFIDPPYPTHRPDGSTSRDGHLYGSDRGAATGKASGKASRTATDELRDEILGWCREWGPDPQVRIAVCGYDTDGYAGLVAEGWTEIPWATQGGYGNRGGRGRDNGARERIYFSPHCLDPARVADPIRAIPGRPLLPMFGDDEQAADPDPAPPAEAG